MILPTISLRIERWKFNKDYGIYVSTLGNFKDRYKRRLPIKIDQGGYCRVKTEVPKAPWKLAHRLVMLTWKPIPDAENLTVDHLNHNKRDNSLDNLEWVTKEENVRRAKEDFLKPNDKEIKFAADELKDKEVELKENPFILVNGVEMKMSAAIALVKNMSTVDATYEQVKEAIYKALNGKKQHRYAGLKFLKIK